MLAQQNTDKLSQQPQDSHSQSPMQQDSQQTSAILQGYQKQDNQRQDWQKQIWQGEDRQRGDCIEQDSQNQAHQKQDSQIQKKEEAQHNKNQNDRKAEQEGDLNQKAAEPKEHENIECVQATADTAAAPNMPNIQPPNDSQSTLMRYALVRHIHQYYTQIMGYYDAFSKRLAWYWHVLTDNDRIFHYAASLSFYNIFSIIPAFLMLFSLLSLFPSFQGQLQNLQQTILDNILPNNAHEAAAIVDGFLLNGKEMGFIGFLISLVSSFIFFRNFDDIAARIFAAKKRSYFDSFIIYWLLITLVPLFLATSIYFNTAIVMMYSDVVIAKFYTIMPLLAAWLIFAMLFRVAANKPLRFFVLMIASLLGSLVWYGVKLIFFYYMSYNKFYSNIYGSVSIVMFAFLWIYVSWLVVLFSMQFCRWLDIKYPYNARSDEAV